MPTAEASTSLISAAQSKEGQQNCAGGLAGTSSGAITNSYASADVSGLSFGGIGALVGSNSGTISQSYAGGSVSGGGLPYGPFGFF